MYRRRGCPSGDDRTPPATEAALITADVALVVVGDVREG